MVTVVVVVTTTTVITITQIVCKTLTPAITITTHHVFLPLIEKSLCPYTFPLKTSTWPAFPT